MTSMTKTLMLLASLAVLVAPAPAAAQYRGWGGYYRGGYGWYGRGWYGWPYLGFGLGVAAGSAFARPWYPAYPAYYYPPSYPYPPVYSPPVYSPPAYSPPVYDCGTWAWYPDTQSYRWLRCADAGRTAPPVYGAPPVAGFH